jgi:hypothetical protein
VPAAADEEERLPRLHSMFAAIAFSAAVAGMIPAQNEASEAPVEFKIMAQRYMFAPDEIRCNAALASGWSSPPKTVSTALSWGLSASSKGSGRAKQSQWSSLRIAQDGSPANALTFAGWHIGR